MNIHYIHSKKKSINKDIVERLELLLKQAKKGEVTAFSGVVLFDNNIMHNIYSGNIKDNYLNIQGMLNDLSIELKQYYEEE